MQFFHCSFWSVWLGSATALGCFVLFCFGFADIFLWPWSAPWNHLNSLSLFHVWNESSKSCFLTCFSCVKYHGFHLSVLSAGVRMEIVKQHSGKYTEQATMKLTCRPGPPKVCPFQIISFSWPLMKATFLSCAISTRMCGPLSESRKGIKKWLSQPDWDRHPNIMKLFHIIQTRNHIFMVLEKAAEGDLVNHTEKEGCVQLEQS